MHKQLRILTLVFLALCARVHSQGTTTTCNSRADILFILDGSGSVGTTNFQTQLNFVRDFTDRFTLGPMRFSVLPFSSLAHIAFDFDSYSDHISLKNAISNIAYDSGGTDTAAALQLARLSAFTAARGSRTGVPKIAIVLTDGLSNDRFATVAEAKLLKDSGVAVLSLGIGSGLNDIELNSIASYSEDVYHLENFSQLVQIVNEYSSLTCNVAISFTCFDEADVYFMIDSSNRITSTTSGFQRALQFAANVISNADLSKYQFGAATFGTGVRTIFHMDQYANAQDMSQALTSALGVGGATETAKALDFTITNHVFDSSTQPQAVKILVLVTDGYPTSLSEATILAQRLQASGVQVLTVGMTNPSNSELTQLANNVAGNHFSSLNTSAVLSRIQELASLRPCEVPTSPVRDVTEACRMFNWVNGIHPHPYDCTKFIECTFLRTDIFVCPDELEFNPTLETCDYPHAGNFCFSDVIATTAKPCQPNGTAEVLLILDSSRGVSVPTYNSMLNFAANLAENFNLGPGGVQFGGLTFANNPTSLFTLDKYGSGQYKELQQAILGAPYNGGSTNTQLALQAASSTGFSVGAGARPGAPQIALVFTDGHSADTAMTIYEANNLKAAGVFVVAIGSNGANRAELEAIASSPQAVYDVDTDFSHVRDIIRDYSNHESCKGPVEVTSCRGIQFADVVFVLDSSTSIDAPSYQKQLAYVDNVTSNFNLGPTDIRFGAVLFSTGAQTLFDLDDYTTHASLTNAILAAPQLGGGTDTDLALDHVKDNNMFGTANGGRSNASKVVIVMTDGRSNSQTLTTQAAKRLKDDGARIFAIGVGDSINPDELRAIASDSKSYFQVSDYSSLNNIIQAVSQELCESIKVPGSSVRSAPSARLSLNIVFTELPSKSPIARIGARQIIGPTAGPDYCSLYNLQNGNYPDPDFCYGYVECSNYRTSYFDCPLGLGFNTATRNCDDTHQIDCNVNANYYNNLIVG